MVTPVTDPFFRVTCTQGCTVLLVVVHPAKEILGNRSQRVKGVLLLPFGERRSLRLLSKVIDDRV